MFFFWSCQMVKLMSSAFVFKIVLIEQFWPWFCTNVTIINPSTEFTNARLFDSGLLAYSHAWISEILHPNVRNVLYLKPAVHNWKSDSYTPRVTEISSSIRRHWYTLSRALLVYRLMAQVGIFWRAEMILLHLWRNLNLNMNWPSLNLSYTRRSNLIHTELYSHLSLHLHHLKIFILLLCIRSRWSTA